MFKNIIHTPYGTFTRTSRTAYGFAALAEAVEQPERGLRVVGNRKGDPALTDTNARYSTARVRYHIVWSRTEAGARKNAEGYVWQPARCVGVFAVEVEG